MFKRKDRKSGAVRVTCYHEIFDLFVIVQNRVDTAVKALNDIRPRA